MNRRRLSILVLLGVLGLAVAPLRARPPFGVLTGQSTGSPFATSQDGTAAQAVVGAPMGLAVDAGGNLIFGDGSRLRRVDPTGRVTTLTRISGGGIIGVVVDPAGNIFFTNYVGGTVHQLTPQGALTTFARGLSSPRGLARDSQGRLYVADAIDHAIWRLAADGSKTLYAGTPGRAGTTDSPPTLGSRLHGLVFDPAGNLYLADEHAIRRVTPAGVLSTVAGDPTVAGSADGRGSAARFNSPLGLAVDPAGNILVADATGTVRQLDPAGQVTTLASAPGASPAAAGALSLKGRTPVGVAADAKGNVYVLDYPYIEVSPAVATAGRDTRLANLSTRAWVGGGADTLIAGFVIAGAGAKPLLVRGIGPALANFGLANFLPASAVEVVDATSTRVGGGTQWGGAATLAAKMDALGAFPLAAGSADAAFVQSFAPGSFSVQLAGQGGATGVGLAELYDADPSASSARLINLSTRASVGGGDRDLLAGFVIVGNGSLPVLIRGIGPGLGAFGVAGSLPAAQLTVFDVKRTVIATNSGWGGDAALAATFTQVGAFQLAPNSADAAVLLTLGAGSYTVQLGGAGGATGVGLVEIYEVP